MKDASLPLKTDPTRTTPLRRRFVRELHKRIDALSKSVADAVAGLHGPGWMKGYTPSEKVVAFTVWSHAQVQTHLLGNNNGVWEDHVTEAFKAGLARGWDDAAHKEPLLTPPLLPPRGKDGTTDWRRLFVGNARLKGLNDKYQFVRDTLGRKKVADSANLIVKRALNELSNLGTSAATTVSRIVADGVVSGRDPKTIADEIRTRLGMAKNRAATIAETEVSRAFAEAQLDALEQLGVETVSTDVEWHTSGSPCPMCAPLEGIVLRVDEARGLLPRHPRCKCAWLIVPEGAESEDAKVNKRDIKRAIRLSVSADTGTEWPGEEVELQDRRLSRTQNSQTYRRLILPKPSDQLMHLSWWLKETGHEFSANVFCPTGEGGGQDPTCSPHPATTDVIQRRQREILAEISRLKSTYPALTSVPDPHVEVVEGESFKAEGAIGLAIPDSPNYGTYTHGQGKIKIVAGLADHGTPTLGGPTVGQDLGTAFRHEYGHHVQDHIRVPVDPRDGKRLSWQNISAQFVGKDKKTVVSDYAKLNHKEMYAESFSVYTAKGYKRGTLPKPIENYFDVALGVVKAAANAFCPTGKGGGQDPTCGKTTTHPIPGTSGAPNERRHDLPFSKGSTKIRHDDRGLYEHGEKTGRIRRAAYGAEAKARALAGIRSGKGKGGYVGGRPRRGDVARGGGGGGSGSGMDVRGSVQGALSHAGVPSSAASQVLSQNPQSGSDVEKRLKTLGYSHEVAHKAGQAFDSLRKDGTTHNAFCPTGAGGGIDATCPPPTKGKGEDRPKSPTKISTRQGIKDAASKIIKTARALAHAVGKVEHYLSEKIQAGVERLPTPVQTVLKGAWQATMATHTAGQAIAVRIAKERGYTEKQAETLKNVLATVDMVAAKPAALAGELTGIGGTIGFVPIASTGYIAYSTARNPLATARAAHKIVADVMDHIETKTAHKSTLPTPDRPRFSKPRLETRNVLNLILNLSDSEYSAVADSLEKADHSDAWVALFTAALDRTGKVRDALALADTLYEKGTSSPQGGRGSQKSPTSNVSGPDYTDPDGTPVYVMDVRDGTTDNAFCPTGEGGGQDPSCSPKNKGKGKSKQDIRKERLAAKVKATLERKERKKAAKSQGGKSDVGTGKVVPKSKVVKGKSVPVKPAKAETPKTETPTPKPKSTTKPAAKPAPKVETPTPQTTPTPPPQPVLADHPTPTVPHAETPTPAHDVAANRPSLPSERKAGVAPPPKEWSAPPPKVKKEGTTKTVGRGKNKKTVIIRPKGDESQTKIGDLGERLAQQLGFRNILPPGKRSFTAEEVKTKGSSIDLEYDHSGKLYELKLCNTHSTEYRAKIKKEEKEAKLKYAKLNNADAHIMVAVRDPAAKKVHFYAGKEKGLIGSEVNSKDYHFLGSVEY